MSDDKFTTLNEKFGLIESKKPDIAGEYDWHFDGYQYHPSIPAVPRETEPKAPIDTTGVIPESVVKILERLKSSPIFQDNKSITDNCHVVNGVLICDYPDLPLGSIKASPEELVRCKALFERLRTETPRHEVSHPVVTPKALPIGERVDYMTLYKRHREHSEKVQDLDLQIMMERPFDPNLDTIVKTRNPAYMTIQRGKHRSSDFAANKLFYSIDPSLDLGPMNISRTEITYDANGIATTTIETVLFAGDIRGNLVTVIQRQKRVQQK